MRGIFLLFLSLFVISSLQAKPQLFEAKVIAITDGDTIKVLTKDYKQIKIRLAGIDCSEKKQPWGKRARRATSDLVFARTVKIESLKKDRYGRVIGRVFVKGQNINRELVRRGECWAYTKYVKDKLLFKLQDEAQKQGRGFWGAGFNTPPWQWRKERRNRS